MKRMLALALALVMAMSLGVCFTSCGQKNADDLAYVKDKGKLVVGITEFEPMDYKDADGKWVGFDADTATAFAQYIGVDVEFVLIDWDSKTFELDAKNIDCVWNGMTLTDEVKSAMATSKPYFNNAQVVIGTDDDHLGVVEVGLGYLQALLQQRPGGHRPCRCGRPV